MVNKALPFLLLPVLTRYLSPSEYGILSIYQVLISFAVPIVGMNMASNITRNFFNKSRAELAVIVGDLLLLLSLTYFLVSICLCLYIIIFKGSDGVNDIPSGWLLSVPVVAVMNTIIQFNLTILRNQNRALLYGLFEVLNTTVNVGITLLMVVVCNFGWQGRALGVLSSAIIFGIVSLWWMNREQFLSLVPRREQVIEILMVSVPLIFHALGAVTINVSDRLFLNSMMSKETVGIYSVGYQFGMIILLVTEAFNKVWSPWMYKQMSNIDSKKQTRIVTLTYAYNVGILVLALMLTIIAKFLLRFMTTPDYYGAQTYIVWIALGYAVRGMYTMVFPYLVYVGKTHFLGIMTTIAAAVNLLANYLLISVNGAVGAAQATLLSFVILYLGVWWYSNHIYPMPWKLLSRKA